jgi:hypothetical protein
MTPARPLRHLLAGLVPTRQWLTMAELAEHGRFLTRDGQHYSPEAARLFVRRHPDLPRAYRGRQLIVDRADFDRYVVAAGRADRKAG